MIDIGNAPNRRGVRTQLSMMISQAAGFGVGMNVSPSLGLFFAALAAILLVATWILVASSRFIQGGTVERSDRVPQLYGYTVCLIALLWGLTSIVSLIDNTFTLSSPVYHSQGQFGFEPSITSLEAFRLSYDRTRPDGKRDSIPDAELRQRYSAYRADRVAATQVAARQALVTQAISLFLALGLFVVHWRWLRRRPATEGN